MVYEYELHNNSHHHTCHIKTLNPFTLDIANRMMAIDLKPCSFMKKICLSMELILYIKENSLKHKLGTVDYEVIQALFARSLKNAN